jgi:ABC-type transporter Mla MlaB component
MIRITKTEKRSHTIIAIDGQISADTIAVVETCCSQAESHGRPVHLFLRDVTTVDQSGQTLLHSLAERGIRISARGIYTSYLVEAHTATNRAPRNSLIHRNAAVELPLRRTS